MKDMDIKKYAEFIEAVLIIGARRASDTLTHDTAKELISQHVNSLTNRLIKLLSSDMNVQECDATKADSSTKAGTTKIKPQSTEANDDWKQRLAEAFKTDSYEDFDTRERSIAEWMAENY